MEKFKTPRELVADFKEYEYADEILTCDEYVLITSGETEITLSVGEDRWTTDQVRKRISAMIVALQYTDEFNRLLAKENEK